MPEDVIKNIADFANSYLGTVSNTNPYFLTYIGVGSQVRTKIDLGKLTLFVPTNESVFTNVQFILYSAVRGFCFRQFLGHRNLHTQVAFSIMGGLLLESKRGPIDELVESLIAGSDSFAPSGVSGPEYLMKVFSVFSENSGQLLLNPSDDQLLASENRSGISLHAILDAALDHQENQIHNASAFKAIRNSWVSVVD